MGLVSQVFAEANIKTLLGHCAVGHTRYSTEVWPHSQTPSRTHVLLQGGSELRNAQPFVLDTMLGPLGLAHNGTVCSPAIDPFVPCLCLSHECALRTDHQISKAPPDGDAERRGSVHFFGLGAHRAAPCRYPQYCTFPLLLAHAGAIDARATDPAHSAISYMHRMYNWLVTSLPTHLLCSKLARRPPRGTRRSPPS